MPFNIIELLGHEVGPLRAEQMEELLMAINHSFSKDACEGYLKTLQSRFEMDKKTNGMKPAKAGKMFGEFSEVRGGQKVSLDQMGEILSGGSIQANQLFASKAKHQSKASEA